MRSRNKVAIGEPVAGEERLVKNIKDAELNCKLVFLKGCLVFRVAMVKYWVGCVIVLFCALNLWGLVLSPMAGFFFILTNACVSAILVVLAKNPINALFFLVSTFLNASIFLLLLKLDFLAIIFIIVYIGAISVFFLFMIMMLNISVVSVRAKPRNAASLFVLTGVGSGVLGISVYVLVETLRTALQRNQTVEQNLTAMKFDFFSLYSNIYEFIGHFFYTYYSLPLLLISIFLLVVMIGVIVLPVLAQKVFRPTVHNAFVFLKTVNP